MIRTRISIIISFVFLSLVISSCKKDVNQSEIDQVIIEDYVVENNLDGQFTSSGLYYVINEPGSANHPTVNSQVTVSYVGYTLNGVVFDEKDYKSFWLYQVIEGWQEGIQLIGEGGKIKLIIPSGLAYGPNGSGSIGPDEVLAFDITLHYFQN